jgi:hypothetical protein
LLKIIYSINGVHILTNNRSHHVNSKCNPTTKCKSQQQSVNHLATKLIVTIVNYHERTDRGDVMYTISARWRLILWAVLKASSHRTFVHLVFTELYMVSESEIYTVTKWQRA